MKLIARRDTEAPMLEDIREVIVRAIAHEPDATWFEVFLDAVETERFNRHLADHVAAKEIYQEGDDWCLGVHGRKVVIHRSDRPRSQLNG